VKTELRTQIAKVSCQLRTLWVFQGEDEYHASSVKCFAAYLDDIFNTIHAQERTDALEKLTILEAELTDRLARKHHMGVVQIKNKWASKHLQTRVGST